MRILLIEDDFKIADILSRALAQHGHEVEHKENGLSGLELAAQEKFDAAIVDLMLPDVDGMQVVERIRAQEKSLPLLILSARRDVSDRVLGLKQGADDYLTKPFAIAELVARIDALVRRSAQIANQTSLAIGDLELDLLQRTAHRGGVPIDLQPMEFELLRFLAQNAGKAVTRAMIIERVWKYNFDPKTNIVEARMSKLRDKIDKGRDQKLIHTIRGVGYVLEARK